MKIISHTKDIKLRQYEAERLVAEFTTEIKSLNFGGNKYLSIEGVKLEYYKKYDYRKFLTKNTFNALIGEFNTYLSGDMNQYE